MKEIKTIKEIKIRIHNKVIVGDKNSDKNVSRNSKRIVKGNTI